MTDEEMLILAQQAAEQTAADRAVVETLVEEIKTDQLVEIGKGVETIREAINAKGVEIDASIPLSSYGDKILEIPTEGGTPQEVLDELEEIREAINYHGFNLDEDYPLSGYSERILSIGKNKIPPQVLVANDERIRWFNIDSSEKIDHVQDPTYSGNLLVMNGKLFRIFGPVDKNDWNGACEPICERTDLKAVYYYWDNNYLLLTDYGEVYHCRYSQDTSVTPSFPIPVRLITSGANDIIPTDDRVFYIKKGNNVEAWYHDHEGNFSLKATATGIVKFLMKRTNTNYSDEGYAHGIFCRDTSGNMVALYSLISYWEDHDSYLHTKIVNGPPAEGDSWEEFNFEQYYHEEYEGNGVKILFATTSTGSLYYTSVGNQEISDNTSSLNLTICTGVHKVKCCPKTAESYASYYWNEETEEEGYKAYTSKVAIAVDNAGILYKIKANLKIDGWSSTFTGLSVTQVLPELHGKCKWCYGNIGKNDRCIAQSDKNMILITSDNSEEINLQYKTGAYIEKTTIKYAWSPADGDWCVLAYNE